jgi:hypothetical protein
MTFGLARQPDGDLKQISAPLQAGVSFGWHKAGMVRCGVSPMIRLSTRLLLLGVLCAAPAHAEEDCEVPMAQWQPRAAVVRLAAEKGWDLRRIRIDDGCYEVIGRDATGRDIEVKLDPATLKIVEMEFEDHPHGAQEREPHENETENENHD